MPSRYASHSFQRKKEAQWQLKRWKPTELVESRRHTARQYASKPWLTSFHKGVLSPNKADRVGTILDVGCGTGFFTRFIANEVVHFKEPHTVIGADLNRNLLNVAKKSLGGHPNIEYLQASAYNLPFRSDSFDLVTCRTVLMHLSSPSIALQEMRRTTRLRGRVACEEPDWGMTGYYNPTDPEFAEEDRRALAAEILGRARLYGQDPSIGRRLPELLYRAGLKDITIDGTFQSIRVPCDRRVTTAGLVKDLSHTIKHLSDRKGLIDYKKCLRAGGLTSKEVNHYVRAWRTRTEKRIEAIRESNRAREEDASFFAVPFFLAVGTKLDDS